MLEKIARLLRELHREDKGFTLIELLIVIAIIAIIAAIAIPTVANRIDSAREAADKANVKLLQGLVDLHYIDKGTYPGHSGNEGADFVVDDTDWIQTLVDEGYLLDPVESPYPSLTDPGTGNYDAAYDGLEADIDFENDGYALIIKDPGGARPTGKVVSTQIHRWEVVTPN